MSISGIKANGIELGQFNFLVSGITGYIGMTALNLTLGTVPRRPGQRLLAPSTQASRDLTINGIISGTTVSIARNSVDTLQSVLTAPNLLLEFQDITSRVLPVKFLGMDLINPSGPQFLQRRLQVSLKFKALVPYFQDSNSITLTGLMSGNVIVPIGTAPSYPVHTIVGPSTNPSVSVWNNSLSVGRTLSTTVSLTSGQTMVIDHDKRTITINGVNALQYLTGGDFWNIDPSTDASTATDSYLSTSLYPYVVAAGGGTCSMTYKRTWL